MSTRQTVSAQRTPSMTVVDTLVAPVVTALPAGKAGQVVQFSGGLWSHDGTSWNRAGNLGVTTFNGRALVNVGAKPIPEFFTSVSDTRAVNGAHISAQIAYAAPPTKDLDEIPMDVINVWAYLESDGYIGMRLTGMTGYIADEFYVDYQIHVAA